MNRDTCGVILKNCKSLLGILPLRCFLLHLSNICLQDQLITHSIISTFYNIPTFLAEGIPVANVLDSDIVVSKFELQSHYYIHFRKITIGKSMSPFIPPAMG